MFIPYGVTLIICASLVQSGILQLLEESPQYVRPTRQNDVLMCPYISDWKYRAEEFCHTSGDVYVSISKYHCLEKQTGGYVELCMEPVTVKEGLFPKFTPFEPPRIYFERCPHGFYQPREQLSSDINKCKIKSKCSRAVGQLSSGCPEGGATSDQKCRCDFQRGYIANLYAFNNPQNKSCFTPSIENSACSMDNTCVGDRELDRAYRCVPKCPQDWYRPPEELECKPKVIYKTSTGPSTKTITARVTSRSKQPEDSTTLSKNDPTNGVDFTNGVDIAGLIGKILPTVLVVIGIALIVCLFLKLRKSDKVRGEAPGDPQQVQHVVYNINAKNVEINQTNIETVENLMIGDNNTMAVSKEN